MARKAVCLTLAWLGVVPSCRSETVRVDVPAVANIVLAGAEPGDSIGADSAPANSPVFIKLPLRGGSVVTIDASGNIRTSRHTYSPAGTASYQIGSLRGLSGLTAPAYSLAGVFIRLKGNVTQRPPPMLNFAGGAKDLPELQPLLQQVFYVGDGRVSGGASRRIIVPEGAAALYLGIHAGMGGDRSGAFQATVRLQ